VNNKGDSYVNNLGGGKVRQIKILKGLVG